MIKKIEKNSSFYNNCRNEIDVKNETFLIIAGKIQDAVVNEFQNL